VETDRLMFQATYSQEDIHHRRSRISLDSLVLVDKGDFN
jgi:hypothetical protein